MAPNQKPGSSIDPSLNHNPLLTLKLPGREWKLNPPQKGKA